MLEGDPRTGHRESGTVTITSGDGDSPQTVVNIPSDALFVPTEMKVEYDDDGTAVADVEIHDNADGTAAGNVDDLRESFKNLEPSLSNGYARVESQGPWREFENDVLAKTGGNQDNEIVVTVKGVVLTALEDMQSF